MRSSPFFFTALFILTLSKSFAQQYLPHYAAINSSAPFITYNVNEKGDTIKTATQKDIRDILRSVFVRDPKYKSVPDKKVSFTTLPGFNYTNSSGFSLSASSNLNYYASTNAGQKLSSAYASLSYSQKKQIDFIFYSAFWTRDNNYSFQGNSWYLQNVENTYGIGSLTSTSKKNKLSYNYIRLYETVLKKIHGNIFGGLGYKLDYHYNIAQAGNEDGSVSDFSKYGYSKTSVSSGLSVDFLFDTRRNSVNPPRGTYLNVAFSPKMKPLGSNDNWQSFVVDGRKYFNLPGQSKSILAFWTLLSFTSGKVPYLDLPSNGWDYQQKSGRGYIQGRYRGRDMLYLEIEYRFGLTNNGLLGAVVFANAETFSDMTTRKYDELLPGAGAGLRIKLNKRSGLNASIAYGIGAHGSRGLFFNVGEVF
jgi:hypothetical protein